MIGYDYRTRTLRITQDDTTLEFYDVPTRVYTNMLEVLLDRWHADDLKTRYRWAEKPTGGNDGRD